MEDIEPLPQLIFVIKIMASLNAVARTGNPDANLCTVPFQVLSAAAAQCRLPYAARIWLLAFFSFPFLNSADQSLHKMLAMVSLLLVPALFIGRLAAERCPRICICDSINYRVMCLNKNLTKVPADIPQVTPWDADERNRGVSVFLGSTKWTLFCVKMELYVANICIGMN